MTRAAPLPADRDLRETLVSYWVRSAERLQTLRGSGLLDSPRIPRLDAVAARIAEHLDTAVALVTLVEDDRQFFLASYGLPEDVRQNSIEHTFCKYAGTTGTTFRVRNALEDQVVCHLLAIPELGAKAYMGVPLLAPNGEILGTTCAVDTRVREWTDEEQATLEAHAVVVTAIVLHHGSWDAHLA